MMKYNLPVRYRHAEIINFSPQCGDAPPYLTIYAIRLEQGPKDYNPAYIYRCPLCCKVHVRDRGRFNLEQNGWEQEVRCHCYNCWIRNCSRLKKLPLEARNILKDPYTYCCFILRETDDESRAGHIPKHIKTAYKSDWPTLKSSEPRVGGL